MIRPIGKHLDALYLSVRGELPEPLARILEAHKEEAANSEANRSELFDEPGIPGGMLYVQAKGTRGHEFVIRNSRLYLKLTTQKHLPALQIQFLAEALYEYDLDGLERIVEKVRAMFVPSSNEVTISRVDIAVDFQSAEEEEYKLPEVEDVITRARRRRVDYDRHEKQTLTLGNHGGAMQVQLYNKSAETAKVGKLWLEDVWAAAGYDPDKNVWRAEVRFKREVLHQFGVSTFEQLRAHLGDMLLYAVGHDCTASWCRIADPETRGLQVQTRKSASWWVAVAGFFLDGELFTGRRRLRPLGLISLTKALDMYLAWASRIAALARAGGLHSAGGPDFGKWLFYKGASHLGRKGMTWDELVNRKTSELPERRINRFKGQVYDLPFAGKLFDVAPVHCDLG